MNYRIAGIEVSITGGAEALRAMGGFEPFAVGVPEETRQQAEAHRKALTISLIEGTPLPSGLKEFFRVDATALKEVFFAAEGKTEVDLYGLQDGVLKCHAELDEASGEARIAYGKGCLAALRLALWEVFGWHALRQGVAAIHSATVSCDGRGIMFLGGSGTGKSTHARMWMQALEGAKLLNDDSPIVAIKAEGQQANAEAIGQASSQQANANATVSGSPWGGKTPLFLAEEYPLLAMVRLSQGAEDKMRRLAPLEALTALLPSFAPCMKAHPRLSRELMAMASSLVRTVPVYRLECLPHEAAAQLCHDTVFGKPAEK